MKSKLYFTAIMFLGMMGVSNAQAQNPECMTNLSIFSEHAKVKNYEAAYEPWKMVYETCPQLNNAIYVYGERILKDKVDKATGADKEKFANDLMGLYDNKLKHFSSKTSLCETMVDKALVMYDNKMADDANTEMMGANDDEALPPDEADELEKAFPNDEDMVSLKMSFCIK